METLCLRSKLSNFGQATLNVLGKVPRHLQS